MESIWLRPAPSSNDNDNDDACFDKNSPSSSKGIKRKLPVVNQEEVDVCPVSPAPSLASESSVASSIRSEQDYTSLSLPPPPQKRPKHKVRRVSFDLDTDCLNIFDKYDQQTADDVWWSKGDLKSIMKREGRLVLDLKINPANGATCVAASLKRSINEAFKKCVDAPSAVSQDCPIFEFINEEQPTTTAVTTTRGLERYVAPILGAHRDMVVKSLLTTQEQLKLQGCDPDLKSRALSARYQHMSKVAANFAIVMGRADAQLVTANNL